uniref:Elongator complex protein 6 n=1 Tax=Oreochromis niloticus TaxID=8128 RepID=I3J9Y1_ORENI
MFTELSSILNATPDRFTQGEFILVSDRQSDASFLIHHFLSFYLRAHYSAISQRLGVSLTQAREKSQLIFLEGLKESLSILIPQTPQQEVKLCTSSEILLLAYRGCMSMSSDGGGEEGVEEWGPPVLLVDDVSVLLSLGVSAGAVLDFSHYCRATVCSQLQGNIVTLVRCHGEEAEDDGSDGGSEWLLKGLAHQCSLTLHVQGLPTGYCRDIHGQVEVCWRRRRGDGQHTQKKLFQYKVHNKGASFFAPGTSSAVL